MIKLDIGAGGPSSDSSFISVDKYVPTADIIADMGDLPFKDGEVDVIFASHCLEHISKYQVVPVLREWERVLKVGGRLQILVPDLIWACAWFLRTPDINWAMDILFGLQNHDGEYHKTGFTPEIMKLYLEDIPGLKLVDWSYYGNTLEDINIIEYNDDGYKNVRQRSINFEIIKVDPNEQSAD